MTIDDNRIIITSGVVNPPRVVKFSCDIQIFMRHYLDETTGIHKVVQTFVQRVFKYVLHNPVFLLLFYKLYICV